MSNQRVVVLTDEEIRWGSAAIREMFELCPDAVGLTALESLKLKLDSAWGYPEWITEWRAFVGDDGGTNDYEEARASREEAEVDLAKLVLESGDEPYDRLGMESRQCGPWVESSRMVGQVNG